jgi:hypothetical protein
MTAVLEYPALACRSSGIPAPMDMIAILFLPFGNIGNDKFRFLSKNRIGVMSRPSAVPCCINRGSASNGVDFSKKIYLNR